MLTQDSKILRKGITLCLIVLFLIPVVYISDVPSKNDSIFDEFSNTPKNDLKSSQDHYPYNGSELPDITLELVLHDMDHIVEGVMKIDYFNNDSETFDALLFILLWMVCIMMFDRGAWKFFMYMKMETRELL